MDKANIVIAVLMGLFAGWLAAFVVPGEQGIIQYLVSGVLGSFVGSFVLNKSGVNLGIHNEIARDVVTATIGAIIVLYLAKLLA